MKLIHYLSYLVLLGLYSTLAFGHAVNVDVGDYEGNWRILQAFTSPVEGNLILDLEEGSYTVSVGGADTFKFNVLSNGEVVTQNTEAAVGELGKLTFNTVSVDINVADYLGRWNVIGIMPAFVYGILLI